MTRSLRFLYIFLFLAILLALGLWSLRSFIGFSTSKETTVLNGHWTKAVETHYDEEFPIKRLGTNLWAALDYKVFNEGRPGVILGKDQWLYTDEEFDAVANGEQNEADNLAIIQGVRDTLKNRARSWCWQSFRPRPVCTRSMSATTNRLRCTPTCTSSSTRK